MKPKSSLFKALCAFYALCLGVGVLLFGEFESVRVLRGHKSISAPLRALEKWIKGEPPASEANSGIVRIDSIQGSGSLLVREFSSLVFRTARQNDILRGRNVLMTRAGVSARLWVADHETWLEIEPNTLLVVEQRDEGEGSSEGLVLSFLAGDWKVRPSKSRNPASSGPALEIRDLTKTSSLSPPKTPIARTEQEPEQEPTGFLAEALGVEQGAPAGPSLSQDLNVLADMLQESDSPEKPFAADTVAPQAPPVIVRSGSLKHLNELFEAETRYIALEIRGAKGRSPATNHISLSVALADASRGTQEGLFTPELAQVLDDYVKLYIVRDQCSLAGELVDNVVKYYSASKGRDDWQMRKIQQLRNSRCTASR